MYISVQEMARRLSLPQRTICRRIKETKVLPATKMQDRRRVNARHSRALMKEEKMNRTSSATKQLRGYPLGEYLAVVAPGMLGWLPRRPH